MTTYTIKRIENGLHSRTETTHTGTLPELVERTFSSVLMRGYSWSREPGARKIDTAPDTAQKLVKALNDSEYNSRIREQRIFYELI